MLCSYFAHIFTMEDCINALKMDEFSLLNIVVNINILSDEV